MADNFNAAEMIKNLLGDDAEDKIKSFLGNMSGDNSPVLTENENTKALQVMNDENIDYANTLKKLFGDFSSHDDPRSQLLLSLKPYMNENRKRSIDSAIRLLHISKISGMFK